MDQITRLQEKIDQLEEEKRQLLHSKRYWYRKAKEVMSSRSWRYSTPARLANAAIRDVQVKRNKLFEKITLKYAAKKELYQRRDLDPLDLLYKQAKVNKKLKRGIPKGPIERKPDSFILYRIIGNDLYPRHKKGQSRKNLRFILENEPSLNRCEKRFIVNRIVDPREEKAIITLLNRYGAKYIHIPFDKTAYQKIGIDLDCLPTRDYLASEEFENLNSSKRSQVLVALYRLKNLYVMNNNGARNVALADGANEAKWILPWDGNCFVTKEAWGKILSAVKKGSHFKYFVVPMARILDNNQLLSRRRITQPPIDEPQLIFRTDATERFEETLPYGRRPKVELLQRLGVPGPWDSWRDSPWDQQRRLPIEAGQFGVAGWVARLFSGVASLEQKGSLSQRGESRNTAIISTLQYLDRTLSKPREFLTFDETTIKTEALAYRQKESPAKLNSIVKQLIKDADDALSRKPYSVIDKLSLPPSNNKHDYWHLAPYWWPNPDTNDGLPYIRKDGVRALNTKLYSQHSDLYDRTRIQRVFDDSRILTLAWYFTDNKEYLRHAAKILRRFFMNSRTKMNPHLTYAQVRRGRNEDVGTGSGIIELKDIYYYLDAVKILEKTQVVNQKAIDAFKQWLNEYLDWLLESPQGRRERLAANNHGTYYDLQVSAIAHFLGRDFVLYQTLLRSAGRIETQFNAEGMQPKELSRTNSQHYSAFNLEAWVKLSAIANQWGFDLWSHRSKQDATLCKAVEYLLGSRSWPHAQISRFDKSALTPLIFLTPANSLPAPLRAKFPDSIYSVSAKYHPDNGITPYWNLGLKSYSVDTDARALGYLVKHDKI